MKQRIAVIGAGLCGSLLSTLLRDRFQVTVIEQGRKNRPIFSDIDCAEGEVNSSINRAEGLGGTTNYWHNALIELTDTDLRKAGIRSGSLEPYYSKAWAFFLSQDELRECNRVREANRASIEKGDCTVAHMVLPRSRANIWHLANARHPGAEIDVVYGKAQKIVPGDGGARGHVVVESGRGVVHVEADYFLVCAGGLATPVLLARSLGDEGASCMGYHDHPMAYVAKVRLRADSRLKAVSCTTTETAEVRAGLVYESGGMKTVVYLRPATSLGLRSIQGPARFILSDLRNDPFSPRKILQLLANLEAVREAVLFKTKRGFRGDCYSVLIFGEQTPLETRGLALDPGKTPTLNWHVTAPERRAYQVGLARFLEEFSADILEKREIPPENWEFRTAAHHSGAASRFLSDPGQLNLEFFSVKGLPGAFVCDGSLLRAAGIANSGLTLVALGYRLAELLSTRAVPRLTPSTLAAGATSDSTTAPGATRAQKVLLFVGAVVLCGIVLALGEVSCRLFTDISLVGNSRELFAAKVFGDSMGNARNVRGVSFGQEVWIDDHGFRFDPSFVQRQGQPALLILGDSVGFGVGVPEAKTFAGLLRRALPGTTVYNSSVIGYALPDYKNVVEHFLPEHPEVRRAVLSFCLNDVSHQSASQIQEFLQEIPDRDAVDQIKTLPLVGGVNAFLRSRSKLFLGLKNLLTDPSLRTFTNDRGFYSLSDEEFERRMQPVSEIAEDLRRLSVDFTVVIAPSEPQLRSADALLDAPQQRLAAYFDAHAIRFIDPLESFRKVPGNHKRLYLSGDAMHFSEAGHQAFFDVILAAFER